MSWLVTRPDFEPIHWITASLVHVDGLHLVGNLFFLWAFGLVVEGHVRADRFLALCFALAFVNGGAQAYFGIEASGQGSSGMVWGLMIIAAICAPRTRVWVFVWYVVRAPRLPETTALVFCLFYLGLIVLVVVGFGVSPGLGPFAVALGAGVLFALIMRKAGWVNGRKTAAATDEMSETSETSEASEQIDEAGDSTSRTP